MLRWKWTFYGQVCAESIGTKHVSGSGGQVDYVRGATQSPGGMSFIAFPIYGQGRHGQQNHANPDTWCDCDN